MQTPNSKVLCGCINCYINCFLKIDNHYAVKHGYNKGPGTGNFDHHNLLHSLNFTTFNILVVIPDENHFAVGVSSL